jgi:hypothetical protein
MLKANINKNPSIEVPANLQTMLTIATCPISNNMEIVVCSNAFDIKSMKPPLILFSIAQVLKITIV